jgi:putative oxidoreductase
MKQFLLLGLRFGLGIVLLYGGVSKIRHPYDFLSAVYAYQILAPTTGLILASLLPWLEVITGGCLICGVMLPGASLISTALGVLLTIATASALARGLEINCGCFGPATSSTISPAIVSRSAGFLIASASLFLLLKAARRPLATQKISPRDSKCPRPTHLRTLLGGGRRSQSSL